MKAYVTTTGVLFTLVVVMHIWNDHPVQLR
jgi:hypothetical protein